MIYDRIVQTHRSASFFFFFFNISTAVITVLDVKMSFFEFGSEIVICFVTLEINQKKIKIWEVDI